MSKIIKLVFLFNIIFTSHILSKEQNFQDWLSKFKVRAVSDGISKNVVDEVLINARYLPKVIEYDRYQPEFYEDTFTYIKKRSSKKK